jgi:GNAT superfamily N-acetyltransferase
MLIRDAMPGDAAKIAGLIEVLGYRASQKSVAKRIGEFTASPSDRLVVAEVEGEVVGLASLHVSLSLEHEYPAAKLSAIVVDENQRRRGVGAALAEAIEAEARLRGCCLIFLTTAERRREAHAFYRRLGYEETGRRFAKWLDGPPRCLGM